MPMTLLELNLDGLVGPTHNYAGLAPGNIASSRNQGYQSNPKEAALQGLAKMKYLHDLGLPQAVLPPQERPDLQMLRRLGYCGSDAQVVERAAREAPRLLAWCSSASGMWTANAATTAPSTDASDGRVHFTPANLVSSFHRALEPPQTATLLREIFPEHSGMFVHHLALPSADPFADEGAANHTRLGHERGLHIFVYGRDMYAEDADGPRRFPARQSKQASEAVARLHQLPSERVLFVRQNPAAIDQGVFHNDVIAVGHRDVWMCHEEAFASEAEALSTIHALLPEAKVLRAESFELTVQEAVDCYLFNSQIVTLPSGKVALIAPVEVQEMTRARSVVDRFVQQEEGLDEVHYLDVRQSMRNGGGPACLRLRVQLTHEQLRAVHAGCMFTDQRYSALCGWVQKRYRDRLRPDELRDPRLVDESRAALDELTQLLTLGSVYPFQKQGAR